MRIPDDIPLLEQHLSEMEAALLVIDPLLSHFTRATNSHVDQEVKLALQPLVDLAHNLGTTVLGNHHLGKDASRGARAGAQGSTAFTDVPRVALGMAYDDEDENVRVVEVTKSNIGPRYVGRNYRLETKTVAGLEKPVPYLVAAGVSEKSVDELLLARRSKQRVPAAEIQALILRELGGGERTRKHLNDIVRDETGANPDSVYKSAIEPLRQRKAIRARKDGTTGPWLYLLRDSESAISSKVDEEAP